MELYPLFQPPVKTEVRPMEDADCWVERREPEVEGRGPNLTTTTSHKWIPSESRLVLNAKMGHGIDKELSNGPVTDLMES